MRALRPVQHQPSACSPPSHPPLRSLLLLLLNFVEHLTQRRLRCLPLSQPQCHFPPAVGGAACGGLPDNAEEGEWGGMGWLQSRHES